MPDAARGLIGREYASVLAPTHSFVGNAQEADQVWDVQLQVKTEFNIMRDPSVTRFCW